MSAGAADRLYQVVSSRFRLPISTTKYVLQQTDLGATVPFLARYRRDETGNLDERVMRSIIDFATETKEVERRREFMLKSLEERQLLTPPLRDVLHGIHDLSQLEDAWEPYKVKKTSLASRGREANLDATDLLQQSHSLPGLLKSVRAKPNGNKLLVAVIVEDISRNATVRREVLEYVEKTATMSVSIVPNPRKNVAKLLRDEEFTHLKKMFEYYDKRTWGIKTMRSHIALAVQRGEAKGVLHVTMACGPHVQRIFSNACLKEFQGVGARLRNHSEESSILRKGMDAALEYLTSASFKSVRRDLKEKAEEEAINVFASNLRFLLLQRPLANARILAMDPGLSNGVKCAALSECGDLLQTFKCSVLEEKSMKLKMVEVVNGLSLNKIVIGNGTASQRTAQLVSSVISENGWMDVEFAVVSEAGSSVYSVSEAANEEFPNIDILFRGAINIGRRVLDPLSELVKIPVKSMGIGMYQHDVNEKKMTKTMNETVESCVASVGINAVTANKYMMEKVPGINKKLVHQIVLAREGSHFNSREDLRNVAGMNESVYKQIVGFFRFPNSKDPLDNTVLLPEWYGYVRELVSIAASEEPKESSPSDVIGAIGDRCLASVARYLSGKDNAAMKNISSLLGCGVECLRLIQKELLHPGMDPRSTLPHAGFMRRKLLNVRELKRGEVLSGVVQSVTPFGAFVDCGLEQHVLVRQLQMSDTHPGQLIEHIVFRELDKLGRPQVHLADHSGSTGFKRQREEEEEGTAKINKVEEHSPLPVGIIEI